jgi:sulfate adenylyltransferase subunit 1 (EFTu-like GTPase family)
MAVTVTLEDHVDVSRGSFIVNTGNVPDERRTPEAMLIWMSETPLSQSGRYLLKSGTNLIPCSVGDLEYRIDINTLHREEATTLHLNEIGRISLNLTKPLYCDSYSRNKATGSFIIIDRETNITVAAGTILNRKPSGNKLKTRNESTDAPSAFQCTLVNKTGETIFETQFDELTEDAIKSMADELMQIVKNQKQY